VDGGAFATKNRYVRQGIPIYK